jgi:hypothetical protein
MGRGQGGLARASPQWAAVTDAKQRPGKQSAKPTKPPGRLSPQPGGLKPFVDFCLAVSRRSRPPDCFAGYDAAPAARRCGVARSGETAAGIDSLAPARLALTGLPAANLPKQLPQLRVAQHLRLQKSANALQRPSWDFISASLRSPIPLPEWRDHHRGWRRWRR